jgi:teichuronic acid biosynthesis glycosyltransferase TuaC
MKVLFVISGNSKSFKISPVIKSQGDSLRDAGITVDYFTITGKGLLGYLKSVHRLRRYIKNNQFDIIHAHYILSGWTAVLAFPGQPVILSLMGTDVFGEYINVNKRSVSKSYLTLLTYLVQPFVSAIICKSKGMEQYVYTKYKSYVIPNGVSLENIAFNEEGFKDELQLNPERKYVLFLGNKDSRIKNFNLLKKSLDFMDMTDVSVIAPYPVLPESVFKYLNSSDVLVVPSFTEGSPNVVKEAMACNCQVVATNVGDIEWLFGDEPGYFISTFEPEDMAEKIKQALLFSERNGRTNGRRRIIDLGLDSKTVAGKLVDIYRMLLNKGGRQTANYTADIKI